MNATHREIDEGLVQRAQSGDRTGLRLLVQEVYPLVHRWALVRTGDPSEADDLTQDVMIQMIRRLGSYQGNARFSTWLYSVTRNAATDRQRKSGRQARALEDAGLSMAVTPDSPPGPDTLAERASLSGVVQTFLRELPVRQREVLDLVDLQGLSSPEAAERLGIEPVSVRASLFKARRALRRRILEGHPHLAEDFS